MQYCTNIIIKATYWKIHIKKIIFKKVDYKIICNFNLVITTIYNLKWRIIFLDLYCLFFWNKKKSLWCKHKFLNIIYFGFATSEIKKCKCLLQWSFRYLWWNIKFTSVKNMTKKLLKWSDCRCEVFEIRISGSWFYINTLYSSFRNVCF